MEINYPGIIGLKTSLNNNMKGATQDAKKA